MNDIAQQNLKEPEPFNWDKPSGSYLPPPDAIGPDGKALVFTGKAPIITDAALGVNNEGYREYLIDPIVLTGNGPGVDGVTIRFTRASVQPFQNNGKASKAVNYLRACGSVAKPQLTKEYDAAVKMTSGKVFPFTIDWEAYNKDTGERIRGYQNFPNDPARPGKKLAILHAGDTYQIRDQQGNVLSTETVKSEVLFANARVRYFVDASKAKKV